MGRAQTTKDHPKSKRNKYACTQATDKRKLEVQSSNLKFQTGQDGASGLMSEFLPVGRLSKLRQKEKTLSLIRRGAKAERIHAVADNATRMRAGVRHKNIQAHTCLTIALIIEHSRASHKHLSNVYPHDTANRQVRTAKTRHEANLAKQDWYNSPLPPTIPST